MEPERSEIEHWARSRSSFGPRPRSRSTTMSALGHQLTSRVVRPRAD